MLVEVKVSSDGRGFTMAVDRRYVGRVGLRGVLLVLVAAGVVALVGLGANLALLEKAPADGGGRAAAPRRLAGGALVICGGGKLPDSVRDRFVELAGGRAAKIVVIPTANRDAEGFGSEARLDPWKTRGVASVRLLHARSRQEADDPAFVRPLEEATGVWIGGGEQARLTEAYVGTAVEAGLKSLLARGGVIGGTSAGAAVMSRVMIVRGQTEASLGRGFDLLPDAVVDQHFLRRNRIGRLVGVLRNHPDLVGLGVDERTAVLVDVRGRRLRVLGDSYAIACLADPADHPPSPRLEILKPGDEADLDALRARRDHAVASAIDFDAL